MQDRKARRSNRERSEATRAALIAAARRCFVEKGYAETGTPEIVAAAAVTRGALYHHFADKADLLRAVVEQEASAVAARIEREAVGTADGLEALMDGAAAYFAAMAAPGRTRLLLLEGPAVLGPGEMARIDRETGGESLRRGLEAALDPRGRKTLPLEALTLLVSAAFDRAALAVAEGLPADEAKRAIRLILEGLTGAKPGRR